MTSDTWFVAGIARTSLNSLNSLNSLINHARQRTASHDWECLRMPEKDCVFQGSRCLAVSLSRSLVVSSSCDVPSSRSPVVSQSRVLVGAPPSLSQSFSAILSQSRATQPFSVNRAPTQPFSVNRAPTQPFPPSKKLKKLENFFCFSSFLSYICTV